MSRMTGNDRHFGPFTWGPWNNTFQLMFSSGGGDEQDPRNSLTITALGWAIRLWLPKIIKPWTEARPYFGSSFETISQDWEREYGVALCNMGNGYDFLQVHFGAQTHDSRTTQDWCCHLPWKQWDCVRHSCYRPDGQHFATEPARDTPSRWDIFWKARQECPASYFGFEDYDGEMIVATCRIEEREWHKGTGWFRWLKFFSRPKIRRDLDLHFSAEVGTGKGSWKGGTIGTGINMLLNETPEHAFCRYCDKTHERKGRTYKLRFIGPCGPPPEKPKIPQGEASQTGCIVASKNA